MAKLYNFEGGSAGAVSSGQGIARAVGGNVYAVFVDGFQSIPSPVSQPLLSYYLFDFLG